MSFRARNRRSLSSQPYQNETITGDFRNALSEGCAFKAMVFEDCQMGLASFYKSIFVDCEFRNSTLVGANFNGCSFKNVHFLGCNLDQAQFKSATFDGCSFVGGRAEYATFDGSGVKDVLFDLQLHGADLRFHGAINVDYGDSNLWASEIKVGCRQFVGQRLSQRQLELFIGLLSKSAGNDILRQKLRNLMSPEMQKVIDKVTLLTEVF